MPDLARVDRRTQRTRAALMDALIGLLSEQSFDAICVEQIADRAGVSKTTFLRHYRDKYELLAPIAERRTPTLVADLAAAAAANDRARAALLLCRFVEENSTVLRPLLTEGPAGDDLLRTVAQQVMGKLPPDLSSVAANLSHDLLMAYSTSAVSNLLTWWMRRPAATTAAEMARTIDRLVFRSLARNAEPEPGPPQGKDCALAVPPRRPGRAQRPGSGGGLRLADCAVTTSLEQISGFDNPTRQRLIIAGERMLGSEGFDRVALHKIAAAAGQANTYAVQYHFGNLDGLIDAILEARLRGVKARQKELLERADARGLLGDVPAMLEVIFLPMAEQVNAEGHHSYARFWLQYFTRRGYHFSTDPRLRPQSDLVGEPVARLVQLLGTNWNELTARLSPLTFMMYAALIERDSHMLAERPVPALEAVVSRCIGMMDAALRAPLVSAT